MDDAGAVQAWHRAAPARSARPAPTPR